MKKLFMTALISVVALTMFFAVGCGKDGGGTAGTAPGGVNLLTMLPDSASGVITVNFKKVAQLDIFDKMIKEAKAKEGDKPAEGFKDYQDFVEKTGIDPKTDVFGIAIAVMGKLDGAEKPDGVLVANLNYDKAKILGIMAEKQVKYTEEMYKDVAILKVEDEKEDGVFAFVKEGIIAAGKIDGVKKVIDLANGEGKSIMDNAKMKSYIDDFKADALMSMVVEFPEDVKKVHNLGMAQVDLTKAEVILGHFNYSGSAYTGEISMVCPNPEGNNQLVTTLNGFKGMAAMGGPEVMELVNSLTLSASDDKVTLAFNIPDALLEKLQKKMEEKTKGMMAPPETEDTEEAEETTN